MARRNILEDRIDEKRHEGFCLWGKVDGKNSLYHNSNVSKMLKECEDSLKKHYEKFEVIVVEGGKRQYRTMGRHLAVMFRTRIKE